MFSNYGPLCTELYNLTKPVGTSLNGDIDYYQERLNQEEGLILEAGVGTGRMLIPLLQAGLQVHGIDHSQDMLNLCHVHCQQANLSTKLYHGSLETLNLPDKYNAIIMPASTFCLVEDSQTASKILNAFYQQLNKHGRLIIDIDLPFYPELGEISTTTHPLSATSGITLESKTVEIDWLSQQVVSYLKYEKWCEGQLVGSELQRLALRWFGLTELRLLLEQIGFHRITVSADYDFTEIPTNSNQTITFEAHK